MGKKFRVDISNKDNSITHLFEANRDNIIWSKSVPEITTKVKKIFEDNQISTYKSREILFKLEHTHMSLTNALLYIQNTIHAGSGRATY